MTTAATDPVRVLDEHINIAPGHLGRFRKEPIKFISRLTVNSTRFFSGVGWRAYNDYIGARLFVPDMTRKLKQRVVDSPRVADKIAEIARDKGVPEAKLRDEARRMIDGLAADLSGKTTVRFGAYLINQMFIRLYQQGIHIVQSQFMQLREVALRAQEQKVSLFFAPCHRSHIDYMVLSYLFYRMGISLPFVASGDNLNMPFLGTLMSYCGAFFIRRSFQDDPLYNAIFKEYIECLLEDGYNLEAFVEGTRSRTGKLLNPKFGVLKILVDGVLSGRIKDVYVCPISIGYDRVLETESYVTELLGAEKTKESLSGLLRSASVLQLSLGRIDVRFSKPFSLRAYVQDQILKRPAFDPYKNREMQMVLLRSLGYFILTMINDASLIMPSALVGTILLTLRGRGVGFGELVTRVQWLRSAIMERGGIVVDFGKEAIETVVERAIQTMGDLVGKHTGLLETVLYANKRYELSYYRNEVLHLFVDEAIVCTALYACFKIGHNPDVFGRRGGLVQSNRTVGRAELLAAVTSLSQMLKTEFIFAAGTVEENMDEAITMLASKNVLHEDADGGVRIASEEFLNGRENFDFFCFLLWPFVETYWLAAVTLFAIPPGTTCDGKLLEQRLQKFGVTMYYVGDLSYFEAINKETLKNAWQRLQEVGALQRTRSDKTEVFQVTPRFEERDRAPLRRLVEEIGRFRREGKNRRDNANTGERTMRLASLAASTVVAPKL
eukprot:Unigene4375_Nuclearia_a/m.13357 Unigene4375_Nuclearia_a/g.13357  ORF Unigene4375_Nuclearia_a/g.13357 Unigene4375_Nuclearia_a/m.13357 type:complete len:723 (+) Unigene4375_Nuclearia_a:178-2346(+)